MALVLLIMWAMVLNLAVCCSYPKGVDVFKSMLAGTKAFRKGMKEEKMKRFQGMVGDLVLEEIVQSAFGKKAGKKIKAEKNVRKKDTKKK
jgi:hypothetical protein